MFGWAKKENLPKSFRFTNGVAIWDGVTKITCGSCGGTLRGKCSSCRNEDNIVMSVHFLNGRGENPAEALLDLAERFEMVAKAAREAAENPKIKYDTMYIEVNPQLPPAQAHANVDPSQKQIGSPKNITPV